MALSASRPSRSVNGAAHLSLGLSERTPGRIHHSCGPGQRSARGTRRKRLLRLQRQLAGYRLLISDELGCAAPAPRAHLPFEVFRQRCDAAP
jgi:hypothetical protein